MQIHLSRPSGQKEGPFTLEQIIQDLAARKYQDTDYWAWHEGMTEWVPLYLLPGISPSAGSAPALARASEPNTAAIPSPAGRTASDAAASVVSAVPRSKGPQPARCQTSAANPPPAAAAAQPEPKVAAPTVPEHEEQPTAISRQLSSEMPASALEQIFMFTTGDGPSAWRSPTVVRMVKEITGEDLSTLRKNVPRDVVARCAVGELLKPDGAISDAVWQAMGAHRSQLVQRARDRLYRICVRSFRVEAETVVALVLFYNKQKL